MGRTVKFFVALLVTTIGGVIFITPHGLVGEAQKKFAKFEFNDYAVFKIGVNGIQETLYAKKGYHYDTRDILESITYTKDNGGQSTQISAKSALYYDNMIEFNQSVTFKTDNNFEIVANNVFYDIPSGIVNSDTPYHLKTLGGEFHGNNFIYNFSEKKLYSEGIHGSYRTK
mgnify:FL=1